jgi:signal transduction histidine kinase
LLAAGRANKGAASKTITFQVSKKLAPAYVSVSAIKEDTQTTTFIVVTDLRQHMQEDIKKYTYDLEKEVEYRTKQLQEKERLAAIGQTASMVGHDIRNPLQSIIGELFLAKEEIKAMPNTDSKAQMKQTIESIEEQTFYINKIVADLQDYTRPLAPRLELVRMQDSINESLTSIVLPDNITLEKQITGVQLTSDPLFIKRILVNLISNAIQAMPRGGKLIIVCKLVNDTVKISVSDTGTGIPDSVKSQIFQPLFTTKAKGQGLGLSVVKRLVEALKGSISFVSKEGDGTTFTVTIPRT